MNVEQAAEIVAEFVRRTAKAKNITDPGQAWDAVRNDPKFQVLMDAYLEIRRRDNRRKAGTKNGR